MADERQSLSDPLPLTLVTGGAGLLAACGGGEADARLALSEPANALFAPLLGDMGTASPQSSPAAPLPTANQLLDWAERAYPQFFPGHEVNAMAGDTVYRYYPSTGNYVGVSGQSVLVLGPTLSNGQIRTVGVLGDFAEAVSAASGTLTDPEAARFLLHAQFSASLPEVASVRTKGYPAWLEEQFARPSSQSGWDWLVSKGYSAVDTHEYFFTVYPGDHMAWYQIAISPDGVRRRLALALSEFFVVSLDGINDTLNWSSFAIAGYWDLLCDHAFGNFRTLLEQVTLNIAMGAYLNTLNNQKEDARTGRLPDENYAREVMQLFTIGLNVLNIDGTPQTGPGGALLDSYTQDDVSNLARVFTGYVGNYAGTRPTNPNPPFQSINPVDYARRPMVLDASRHSMLEKRFLGTTIAANTAGGPSLQTALNTLFNHANVGPFFGRHMIQRLVTGNPSPGYVARVANVFNNNGAGVRGDLKAVFRAVLLDEEARGAATLSSPTHGKLREPMVRVAQWARTFKVRSLAGTWKIQRPTWSVDTSLAQSPLQAPSVFNFFRAGYVPPSTALAARRATAPEFQIVNESTVSAYVNYLTSIIVQGMWVTAPEGPSNPRGSSQTGGHDIVPDYSAELALVNDPVALVARLNLLLCASQMSGATEAFIVSALRMDRLQPTSNAEFKHFHFVRALLFVMCNPEYLVQK